MFEVLVKLLLSLFLFGSLAILTFSIFKVPIRGNDKQIAILALSLGAVNFYLKFIAKSNVFSLVVLTVFVVLLTILRGYPILYSFAVSFTGMLSGSLIDIIFSFGSVKLKLTTMDKILTDTNQFIIFNSSVAISYLLVAHVLRKWNIGFSLVNRRFSMKRHISPFNYLWILLLTLGVIVVQIVVWSLEVESMYFYLFLLMSVSLLAIIFYGYLQNKRSNKLRNTGGNWHKHH